MVDICGVCAGDNSTCDDCAGDVHPMYCSADGTSAGETDSVPTRVGISGAWQCEDGSTVVFASPGPSREDECSTCDSNDDNDCLSNCQGQTGTGVGVVPGAADPLMDECGVCAGISDSCADCAGTPNGNATVDRCGACDTLGENDCSRDCAGVWGGQAELDLCLVCDTNATNDGQTCADCAGEPNGAAYVDVCGVCDANATNDCTRDCTGVWGGVALLDECSVCMERR